MINIIKKEIDVEESLRKRLEIICDFCNTTPTIINGIMDEKEYNGVINNREKSRDDFER